MSDKISKHKYALFSFWYIITRQVNLLEQIKVSKQHLKRRWEMSATISQVVIKRACNQEWLMKGAMYNISDIP